MVIIKCTAISDNPYKGAINKCDYAINNTCTNEEAVKYWSENGNVELGIVYVFHYSKCKYKKYTGSDTPFDISVVKEAYVKGKRRTLRKLIKTLRR